MDYRTAKRLALRTAAVVLDRGYGAPLQDDWSEADCKRFVDAWEEIAAELFRRGTSRDLTNTEP
jgi:hypothetical protein